MKRALRVAGVAGVAAVTAVVASGAACLAVPVLFVGRLEFERWRRDVLNSAPIGSHRRRLLGSL